jgi:fumarylacetoacetate (FAA) hydrolase
LKLATLADGSRDGRLVVVDRSGERWADVSHIAPTLQAALDDWDRASPRLEHLARALTAHEIKGHALDLSHVSAPLPRAYEWIDASAFLSHVVRVRKARNAEPPETLRTDPLVYQGGSGVLLGPRAPMLLVDPAWGLDFEAELCVVLGDVPQGIRADAVAPRVRLLMLANDVTLRNLVPAELAKGFGFFQSKPATAFSPFAITPDELGSAYHGGRVHLRLRCFLNERLVGDPDAGEMHFSFFDLVAHIAKTRAFCAGTILGSGTVSNEAEERGVTCLAELRARETIAHGKPSTPFLARGDRVRIEMLGADGENLFGTLEQEVSVP